MLCYYYKSLSKSYKGKVFLREPLHLPLQKYFDIIFLCTYLFIFVGSNRAMFFKIL